MFKPMVLTTENDKTGALVKVEILKIIIESNDEYLANENIIALYGGWGSGKSSVVESLTNEESENKLGNNIKTLVFEAWEYEKDENLSLSLFEMLLDIRSLSDKALEVSIREIKTLLGGIKGLAKSINISTGIISVSTEKVFEAIEKVNEEYLKKSYYSNKKEVKNNYKKLIEQLKGESAKLIVFVDDLDRCENENILNLITSLKHIFSEAEDIIFVVAIDKVAVTQALKVKYGENSEKAEEYLEKVFPVSLSLPKESNLEIYFKEFGEFDREVGFELLRKYGVVTPRKLNKLINKMRMVTSFSSLYKNLIKELDGRVSTNNAGMEDIDNVISLEKKQKEYLNYLIFILILEETAPKHLQVFYEKINRLKITTGNTELSRINQFVVDEMTSDDFEKIGSENKNRENQIYDLERNKNPASEWGTNNHTRISTLQFLNMGSYINDINKYI